MIYNKKTGFISSGAGRLNRSWDEVHKDGSTVLERISDTLSEDSSQRVIYLPDQDLPDPARHKIKDGKIVNLTEADKRNIEAARPKSEIELLKERMDKLEKRL